METPTVTTVPYVNDSTESYDVGLSRSIYSILIKNELNSFMKSSYVSL